MTELLASGRRAATPHAPRLLTGARWRTLRGALTMTVLGTAAIVAVQLGATAPATSPVQPPAAQTAVGAVPATTADDQRFDGRTDGGRDRRGDGR